MSELKKKIERIKAKQREMERQEETENAPLPRPLSRISPFFPVARSALKERPFLEDVLLVQNNWGTLKFTGPLLSTYDEDVFLALLALMDRKRGEDKFIYQGPILPVLKLMDRKPGKESYQRVKASIKRLFYSGLTIEEKGGKWYLKHFLEDIEGDDSEESINVSCDVFFKEHFEKGQITLLDVNKRARLHSPTGKAIHRFIVSHKGNSWKGHYKTLGRAINLDMSRPNWKVRETIKKAIGELVQQKILEEQSGFFSKEIIYLQRRL